MEDLNIHKSYNYYRSQNYVKTWFEQFMVPFYCHGLYKDILKLEARLLCPVILITPSDYLFSTKV